jgi:transcriptional regulator with XRE-family HTH domain
MTAMSFKDHFAEAEKHPGFHKELAILEFTEELNRVMQEQGVSGTELGRRIGSSQAYISRVLNGGANFTLGTMTKLAMGLGMELKMHLAPSGATTVFSDAVLSRPGDEGPGGVDESGARGAGYSSRARVARPSATSSSK